MSVSNPVVTQSPPLLGKLRHHGDIITTPCYSHSGTTKNINILTTPTPKTATAKPSSAPGSHAPPAPPTSASRRSQIFLATKFGYSQNTAGAFPSIRSDLEFVVAACEKSLRALQTDYIDLYLAHRIDAVTPIEHTIAAMARLKAAGKIRHLGLSEVSAATLRRAHAVHPIAAVEVEYSMFSLEIESEGTGLLAACRELGVAVVAYSPLGRGMLTGRYRAAEDFGEGYGRRSFPRFSAENFGRNLELVEALKGWVCGEEGVFGRAVESGVVVGAGGEYVSYTVS
jgi:hypothetical protein